MGSTVSAQSFYRAPCADRVELPAGFLSALDAIHGEHRPMTAIERAAFESAKAAEMQRAEARRAPAPQVDLWGAK